MLSIGAMAAGQEEYYLHLANEDYYLEGGEPPGQWLGQGADALGLQGEVQGDQLRNLLRGFSADGSKALVQNAGSKWHQPGWDLTFSAPKSVSVIWSQVDEQTRQKIQDAHRVAVKAAINYLEESASFSRRGKAGCVREPAGSIVATFEHCTSRALDPQLHTHCLVMNVATRSDGTTGALVSKPLYEHKMTAGALYRVELANQLEQCLGLRFERVGSWVEVMGVPKSVMTAFSQRRTAIEEALSSLGSETASAAAFATLQTRKPKELVPARSDLFQQWKEQGQSLGFNQAQVSRLTNRALQRDRTREYGDAYQRAVARITETQSHFSEKDLIRHVAEESQGRGLDAKLITGWGRRDLKNLVEVGTLAGEKRYTTQEMIAVEARLLETAARLQANAAHQIPAATVEHFLSTRSLLSLEQRRAVLFVTSNPGSVQVVSGMAGTGKTTMLWVCREIWEKEGYEVLGATVAGKAARQLEEGAGIQSNSIAKRFWDLDHPNQGSGKDRFKLTPKSILVVDEAGMVGTRMMDRILAEVEHSGSKLVMIGDAGQLQPIEAGGPFRALGKRLGQTELTEIRRQREKWAQKAVLDFARGNSRPALEAFAERGLLSISENREQAIQKLVADWKQGGLKSPKEHLIFVGTNLEASRINRLCQTARLEAEKDAALQRIDVSRQTLWQGDRILCTKRSRMLGVENGDTGTIVRIDQACRLLTVQLDRGQAVLLPVEQYADIRLGYALTTHKGQGATVENAYVLCGGSMQDREITYVQASRARGETRLYSDALEAGEKLQKLVGQTARSGAKILAHDVPAAVQEVVKPILQIGAGQ